MKKKKRYIREDGICQFFDNWSDDGVHVNYQKLHAAMFHPETIEQKEIERSTESYQVELIKGSKETIEKSNNKPFNRNYKEYGKN